MKLANVINNISTKPDLPFWKLEKAFQMLIVKYF